MTTADLLSTILNNVLGPPTIEAFRPNRVDALPGLIRYHDPNSSDPKPARDQETKYLPVRTVVHTVTRLADLSMDQAHAHYEEIDTIPAAGLGLRSSFQNTATKHWYLIHPLPRTRARELSTRVLVDLKAWIQSSEAMYVGKHEQVCGFRKVRAETFECVRGEIERRGFCEGEVRDDEGYLGRWLELDEDRDEMNAAIMEEGMDLRAERGDVGRPNLRESKPTNMSETLTDDGIAAADTMAMHMVEEARKMKEDMEWEEMDADLTMVE